MSDELQDLRNDNRNLRDRVLKLETEIKAEKKWLVVIGGIFAAILGFTNLVSVPGAAQSHAKKAVADQVDSAAEKALKEWFEDQGSSTTLENIARYSKRAAQAAQAAEKSEGEADSDRQKIASHLSALGKKLPSPILIDCHPPAASYKYHAEDGVPFDTDLFPCPIELPYPGILYLSLQGHAKTSVEHQYCSFSITVDGKAIDRASRELPALAHSKTWDAVFMAEAIVVERARTANISLRIKRREGSSHDCYIHDPDINGIFVPII